MPSFLTDLYRDLRDRRLLLPAVALVVGLIAVPVALSASSTPAPPPAPTAGPGRATAAEPAVLAEQVGIRNFRTRLEQFKTKNPFKQHFRLPEPTSSALEGVPASGEVAGGSAAEAPSTSATSSSGTGAVSSSGSTTTTAPEPLPPATEPVTHHITQLVTRKVDVKVGPAGSVERIDDVGQLDLLPDQSTPVVAFLGASDDGKRAAFLVSTDVSAVSGDGSCVPDPGNCQFITMKPGQVVKLDYTPDGLTYKLTLVNIHEVKVDG